MPATVHYHSIVTDYLYDWNLQILQKNGRFYVIQSQKGNINKLLNGGSLNSAWAVINSVISEPFQSVVVIKHLDLELTRRSGMKIEEYSSLFIVGINKGVYTLADSDDFSKAQIINKHFHSASSSLKLFDEVIVNQESSIIVSRA